jgi:hypothetical protein
LLFLGSVAAIDYSREGTGLSLSLPWGAISGCLATAEAGHCRREEKEGREDFAKARGSEERSTFQTGGRQRGSDRFGGRGRTHFPEGSHATTGKRKASELDWFDGSAAWRPEPGPLAGAGSAPLPVQAKGNPAAQGPMVESTASTGEHTGISIRQLSCAEVVAASAGLVTGRTVKCANAGLYYSALVPSETRSLRMVKEEGM